MSEDEFGIIYEVQVTEDNICSLLHREIIRLLTAYGPRARDLIDCFALGPNSFKCLETWGRRSATFSCGRNLDGMSFEGIKIVCGCLPFLQVNFKPEGWYFAHQEAKRFTAQTGGVDA